MEHETSSARIYLTSLAKKQWSSSSITNTSSQESKEGEVSKQRQDEDTRRKNAELWARLRKVAEVQKKRELLDEQERQLRVAEEQAEKTRQELGALENGNTEDNRNEQDGEPSNIIETIEVDETPLRTVPTSLTANSNTLTRNAMATTSQAQLERIRIPVFSGNKMDFQKWNAAFTSCVDVTSLSPQFKTLRLEACLTGEAAETIKGLGYSVEAYEAAKARLVRKYGGSRRQIQSHLDELKKLKPIEENNPKKLEKFADILERAVITLKENGRESDLESGTLRTIILGKIPERLLAQYYHRVKENQYKDSLEK